jgi:hypothetical protein
MVFCRFGVAAGHAAHGMFWINLPAVLGCIILVGGLEYACVQLCCIHCRVVHALLVAALRLCESYMTLYLLAAVSVTLHG